METPTSEAEAVWAFLQPWFVSLRRQISPYTQLQDGPEHMRVGSATKDEFWLNVRYYKELRRNWFVSCQSPCFTRQPILNLRETLVLMNLLAKANYPLWLKWMWDFLRVRLPPTVGTDKPYWRVQYSIELVGVREASTMDYFQRLFGDTNYSEAFVRDLELAKTLLASHGIKWETIEPVSVMVRYDPEEDEGEDEEITFQTSIKSVRSLTSIIEYSRTIHKRSFVDSACLLKFAAVHLDMTMTTMDGRLMDALRACISTGVRFECLCLPQLGDTTLLHIGDVASFWRALLGIDPIPGGGFAEVSRLDMAAFYARSHLWAPFCSALATSRTLRVLHLHARRQQSTDSPFGSFAVRRERAWMWLAFALFSSASSTSVETFILANWDFFPGDRGAVHSVTTCADPVVLVCHLSRDTSGVDRPTGFIRRQVVVSEEDIVETLDARLSRSYVRVYGMKRGKSLFTGEMVRQYAAKGLVQVLIPGVGMCWVKESLKAHEETQQVEGQSLYSSSHRKSSFRALGYRQVRFRYQNPEMEEAVCNLLHAMGHLVRSLSLELNRATETTLDHIFRVCPHVESLSVKGAMLRTMDVFTRAYEVYDLPLSSLVLSRFMIHEDALIQFIQSLARDGKPESTLRRLSLGKLWTHVLSPNLFAALASLLETNKTLTHLDYYIDHEQDGLVDLQERYDGQIVEGVSTLGRRQRLFLLGHLGRLLDDHPEFPVDDLVKQLIYQFAEPVIERRVIGRRTHVHHQHWFQ